MHITYSSSDEQANKAIRTTH